MNLRKWLAMKGFFGTAPGGGTGGGGMVVCNLETPSKSNTVADILQGLMISYPNATSVGRIAFSECTALTSVDLPNVTSIDIAAFRECTALTSINLPKATSIGGSVFANCTALTSINIPNVTSIGEWAFDYCTALTSIDLPNVTSVDGSAFRGCTALTSINLPKATSIGDNAFGDCTSLSALILSNTEAVCEFIVTAVGGTKVMTAEGVLTGEGFIYVPTKFYETYVANMVAQITQMGLDEATATYIVTAVLRKIEDYPEICG